MEKRLLISDYCCEEEEFVEEIRVKLNKFIEDIFRKEIDVEFDISPLYINNPTWTVDSHISIRFPSYIYVNKVHGEQIESVGMQLEDKGLQAFYINGKFVKKFVYEWCAGYPIQQHDNIYGIKKEELFDKFDEYVLTC